MPKGSLQNAQYCADLVRARDEDRWLAAHYADARGARALMALYALHCELKRIPGAVSEPALGEIRLQWWRDGLAEIRGGKTPRAHPALEEIAQTRLLDAGFATGLNAVLDASARPLYGEGFRDIDDLAGWLGEADGAVDALAVRLLGGGDDLARAAAGAGAAFALAREGAQRMTAREGAQIITLREGARHAPDSNDIVRCAEDLWKEHAPRLRGAPSAVAPALLHLSLTGLYLRRGAKPFPALKRLRMFAAMISGRI